MTDYDQLSDEQLIAACLSDDSVAWDALISRYERLVYTIPVRYGLTQGEVEDVFQSVWLSLLKNISSLRQPDRVAAWLVTTARRECWERRRGADYERTVSSSLDSLLIDKEGELLWHLYYDSTIPSYADIADELDMPIGSIGPMRARCLKKLRGLVSAEAFDE